MSRRNTTDPLLRAFLDTYKVNLLAIPRQGVEVGDAYVVTSNGAMSTPGKLKYLLTPAIQMPDIAADETLAAIAGKQTRALNVDVGFDLLEGFFSAIGADAVIGKIKAEYQHKRVSTLRFQLKNATRDSVDAFAFGKALIPCRLNAKQPFVQDGNQYFAVVGVLRSRSVTVSTEDEKSNNVDVGLDVLKSAVGGDGKLDVSQERSEDITYEGPLPLAFGVELVKMHYDKDQEKFFLSGITDPKVVRAGPEEKDRRVLVGDPERGDVFLPLT
jgi:hypothetical protein